MLSTRKIKVGKKTVAALAMKLGVKNLIVLKGSKGYVMCGYLNMKAANAFKEVAVKITGVNTIKDALKSKAAAVSVAARGVGLRKNQPIRDVLKIIA